ncbi:MAG: type I methionyl aminopeptidase, partial [bacterium]|nr:type I methionyl aminopeptidase [bacterium]
LAFKGYQGFPAAICTSVNDEVVHCVPHEKRILQEGDIVGIDIGLIYKGFYLDMAETMGVGKISFEAQHLIHATKKALRLGVKKVRAGVTVGDIGNTIQRFVESQELNVVRDFVGHGIGRRLHEEPRIPNYGKRHEGEVLSAGMVIAIEPMVVRGSWEVEKLPDGHGIVTADGSLAAHFEHTVAVTEDGRQILTTV